MSRSVALALVGSAAAFSPMMSMDLGRRSIVQAGAASAVAAPLLRPQEAQAGLPVDALCAGKVITIFDHRGCKRGGPNAEYTGEAAGGADDEMCVKVQMGKPNIDARKFLSEAISLKSKGIDGAYNSAA